MKIAISLPKEFIEAFDEKAKEKGYKSRIKAIKRAMEEYMGE